MRSNKAHKRTKQKQKEIRMHRHSYRSKHTDTVLEHPKPIADKRQVLTYMTPFKEVKDG